MRATLQRIDALLRPMPPAQTGGALSLGQLAACVIVFGMLYGAVMGSFTGLAPGRLEQLLYSALKVPLLLGVTFALALPSFFVLNTLAGLRADFPAALRALASTQAGLTIILASLSPFVALWYAGSAHYQQAILFNGLMFAVASVSAQIMLRRAYAPLIAGNSRHRTMLRVWLILYIFVGIQMGWVLRPFIGSPGLEPAFFRHEMLGNAYVQVWQMIWKVARG